MVTRDINQIKLIKADGSHALLGPSGAHRWAHCLGSTALGMKVPKGKAGFYADEGTAAHHVAAWAIDSGLECACLVGDKIPTESGPIEVTEEMAEFCQVYVDAVTAAGEGHYTFCEVALDISKVTNQPKATGAGDFVILHSDLKTLEVHDLKYGRGVQVSPVDNDQLILYFFGAIETLGQHVHALKESVTTFRGVIHQPRISYTPVVWEVPAMLLWDRYDFYKDRSRKVLNYLSKLTAGIIKKDIEKWPDFEEITNLHTPFVRHLTPSTKACEWCHVKAYCPALSAQVAEETLDFFGDERNPPSQILTTWQTYAKPKFVQHMDIQEIGRVLLKKDLIESFLKACHERAMSEAMQGNHVPWHKLVRGRKGDRKWMDEEIVLGVLGEGDYTEKKLKSVPQIEKQLKSNKPLWQKLIPMIDQAEGKLTLADEMDARPREIVEKVSFDDETQIDPNDFV